MASVARATQQLLFATILLSLFHCSFGTCETEKFGRDCQYTCHCMNQTTCHPDSGQCDSQGCQVDYRGTSCQKYNVARSGTANSSASWSPPEMAIDGQIPGGGFTACFHSADGQQFYPAWWRVDLGAVYPMDDILVHYFHNQGGDRSSGMILNVLNSTDGPAEHCLTNTTPNQTRSNFSCGQSGRILELRRLNWTIAVCEVQVFVCLPHTYGDQCVVPCGECLGGEECDRDSGACPSGCKSGWDGSQCDRCSRDTFGSDCTACGHCLGCLQCHADTGGCPQGCTPGWTGERCDVTCSPGSFGAYCSLTCGRCQGNASCHHVTGICQDGCQDGWEGLTCNHPSPTTCPQPQLDDRFAAGIGVGVGISLALVLIVAVIALLVKWRYSAGEDGKRSKENGARPQEFTREMTTVSSTAQGSSEDVNQRPYDCLEAAQRETNVPNPYEGVNLYQN